MRDSPALAIGLSYRFPSHATGPGVIVEIYGPGIRDRVTTTKPGGFRYGYRLPGGRYTVIARYAGQTLRAETIISPPRDGRVTFLFR